MRKVVNSELALQLGLGKDWVGSVIDDETHEVLAYVLRNDMRWPDTFKRPQEMNLFESRSPGRRRELSPSSGDCRAAAP